MTYKFVTREEIEKIRAAACAAGHPSHLVVPLVALLEALKVSLRILTERDAYREVAIQALILMQQSKDTDGFKQPPSIDVPYRKNAVMQVDAYAARIMEEK